MSIPMYPFNARIEKANKTDLAELAATFNQMVDTINDNMEKLKTHDNLWSELISNVSHDLRTPLVIIMKILDIHNASIKVISKPNQGSAVQFELPVYCKR